MKRLRQALAGRRVPYVPQMEVAECGAACLAMVLAYYGRSTPLVELRQACGVSRDGMSASAVVRAARSYGLKASGLRTEVSGLRKLNAPVILHWELNHFVVLERMTKKGAIIVDPASGRRLVSNARLSEAFTGVVLLFAPLPGFERRAQPRLGAQTLLSPLRSFRRPLWLVLGAALLLELLSVFLPVGNQLLVDHVLRPQRHEWLWPLALALVGAAVVRLALTALRAHTLRNLSYGLDLSLMSSFVDHLLALPASFFGQRTVGDLMQRVDANQRLRELSYQVALALLDGLLVLTYAALMLAYDLTLGALVIALSTLRVAWVFATRERSQQVSASELAARGREQGAVVEAFAVPELVKAACAEERMVQRYGNNMSERINATLALRRLSSLMTHGTSVLDGTAFALVLWWGGQKVLADQMTLGVFAGFLALLGLLRAPLASVVGAASQLLYARGILSRMEDVLHSERERSGGTVLDAFAGALELERVSFRYGPTSPWVCQDVSLRVLPGEMLAIVGKSGSGKSSLAKLVLGTLIPSEGKVRWDGRDLNELDLTALRRQIGVVAQEPTLFSQSVRQNIDLAERGLTHAELQLSARRACIDDVIHNLPNGYDQVLAQRGARLSGGQRQRLTLARALAHTPRVLVLDEATSSLDATVEAKVHHHLSALSCTRIVIAHRLSTVQKAHRIVVLDQGRIVQQGTFNALISTPGPFADLSRALWS